MKVEMIVLFAHWCPICNMMMPVVETVEKQYQEQLTVIRIDVEREPLSMEAFEAEIVPTFILQKDCREIGRMSGLISEEVVCTRVEQICQRP